MANYDTQAIRAAAARLSRLADDASQMRRTGIKRIVAEADKLRGDTANACEEQAESLDINIRDIATILTNSANGLYAFARRLDEADRRAQQMVGEK